MCSVWVEISLYWQLLDHRQTVHLFVNKETNQWDFFFIRKEYSKSGKEILNLFGNWSRAYLAGCQIDHLSAAAPNIRKSASQARSYIKIQAFLFPELSKKYTKYMFPRKSQKCSWSEIIWHFLYPSKYDMQSTTFILCKIPTRCVTFGDEERDHPFERKHLRGTTKVSISRKTLDEEHTCFPLQNFSCQLNRFDI